MYCRKCGRKLKSGMRFCDYCGQPVNLNNAGRTRQNPVRTTKKNNDTEAARKRAQYERNKKRREMERKKAQKNRRIALFAILLAIAAAVVFYFISNKWMKSELEKENIQTGASNEVVEETMEEQPTEEEDTEENTKTEGKSKASTEKTKENAKNTESKASPYSDIEKSFNVFADDVMDEISCVYPKSFTNEAKKGSDAVWSGADTEGDGSMVIYSKHVGTSKQAGKLLEEYEKGLGADKITKKESNSASYTITFERNGKITHRKAVLDDGMCIYYDFSYSAESEASAEYKKYIAYMDYYLDEELKTDKADKKS